MNTRRTCIHHLPTAGILLTLASLASCTGANHGSISGAAWLTREDGGSDVVRGMTVYLCSPTVPTQSVMADLDKIRAELEKIEKELSVRVQGKTPTDPSSLTNENVDLLVRARETLKVVDELDDKLALTDCRKKLSLCKALAGKKDAEIVTIYGCYQFISQRPGLDFASRATGIHLDDFSNWSKTRWENWTEILQHASVAKTETNVDGKFVLGGSGIPPGEYVLFAVHEAARVYMDWCMPISVGREAVVVDLHNKNAGRIYNLEKRK